MSSLNDTKSNLSETTAYCVVGASEEVNYQTTRATARVALRVRDKGLLTAPRFQKVQEKALSIQKVDLMVSMPWVLVVEENRASSPEIASWKLRTGSVLCIYLVSESLDPS